MRQRDDLAVSAVTHGVRSEVRGELPLIAGDAAEEETGGAVENRLARAVGIVGEADSGRDVVATE